MNLFDRFKSLTKTQKIAFAGAGVVLIAGIVTAVILINGNGYTATSMRLLRVEGSVNIENSKGESKPVIDKIRFQSGDALNTGTDGLASVGLDDTKIVTLQSDSRVEFQKQNKKLELKLTKGAIYFEVMEHLKDDEIYEIHTSNMTVGIRGTSGYVYYDESDERESLIITDGVVEVSATNPETGETKTARVEGGKQIKVYLYSDRKEDTVEFELKTVSETDLPEFPLRMLAENAELLDKVCEYTGWDKEKLINLILDIDSGEAEGQEIEITPTPEPSEDTETMPTPTPASPADESPTPSPTPASTPTDKPAATPKPTATPTVTTSPSASEETTPTSTIDYEYIFRDEEFEGGFITIRKGVLDGYTIYEGLLTDGTWEKLRFEKSQEGLYTYETYYLPNDEIYYEWFWQSVEIIVTINPTVTDTPTPEPTPDPTPAPVDGYKILERCWNVEDYDGSKVFIIYKSSSDVKGYVNGEGWVDLECTTAIPNDGSHRMVVRYEIKATGEYYYGEGMMQSDTIFP